VSASRICTNVRTTKTDTSIAQAEWSIAAAMMTPCSVKTRSRLRLPPRPGFEVAICDIKAARS